MSYKVEFIPQFGRQVKKLAKKHPSIKADLTILLDSLRQSPAQGVALGNDCYKIRMAISSKVSGKSGGARLITCVKVTQTTVYLLSIFDKSERESISDKEIQGLLSYLPE